MHGAAGLPNFLAVNIPPLLFLLAARPSTCTQALVDLRVIGL